MFPWIALIVFTKLSAVSSDGGPRTQTGKSSWGILVRQNKNQGCQSNFS